MVGGRRLAVDLVTGRSETVSATVRAWCSARGEVRYREVRSYDGEPVYTVLGAGLAFPCNAAGDPVKGIPGMFPTRLTTKFTGGVVVWASERGYFAVK
jgi:hypothetical protein